MSNISPDVALGPELAAYRRDKFGRSMQAIAILAPSLSSAEVDVERDYTLVHHLLESLALAAKAENTEAVETAIQAFRERRTLPGISVLRREMIVVKADRNLQSSDASDTPVFLIGSSAPVIPSDDDLRIVQEGADLAARADMGTLVAEHCQVLVLMKLLDVQNNANSWSVAHLPATVHMDYYDAPFLVGRDLVHESAHNFLNDALVASNSELSAAPSYYSPWKSTERPAFGFIHANWAFSHVRDYLLWAAQESSLPAPSRALAKVLADSQAEKLASTRKDCEDAVSYIQHEGLRDILLRRIVN
jgi:hypothetical protein